MDRDIMSRQSEIIVLMSGGDWADASVDVLKVPLLIDMEQARKDWKVWPYPPGGWLSFAEYLYKYHGAIKPTDTEIEIKDYTCG